MRNGWAETTLDGIAEYINGYPFKPADLGEVGLPVIRIKQLLDPNEPVDRTQTETPERCLLRNGDIVFSWSGTLAVRIWNRGPAKLNQHLFRVVEKKGVYKGIIPLILDHAIDELEEKSHGTTMKHITKQTLLPHKVLLPPLPEQKRIVDLISSVDSYIEALEQQLESAKKSRNAVLHELLTAGGEDWVETTLDRVTECSWGNTETTKSKYVESGFLAYSASGADGFLDWFEHDGTAVVLSAIGAQCGKTWFAEGKWTSIKNTIWLKSDNSNLLDKYLYYLSNTDQFWQIRGQAQPFISLGDVKKTKVLLPPLKDQERIVEVISEMDAFIESIQHTSMEAKNLRSGLLSDLLSGQHEIPANYDKVIGAA